MSTHRQVTGRISLWAASMTGARSQEAISQATTYSFIAHVGRHYAIVDLYTGSAVSAGPINNSGDFVENGNPFLGAVGFPRLRRVDGSYVSLAYPGAAGSPRPGQTPAATITGLNNRGTASGYIFVLPGTGFVRTKRGDYPGVVCPEHVEIADTLVQDINDQGVLTGSLFLPDNTRIHFIGYRRAYTRS
jgi:hypothetical protein